MAKELKDRVLSRGDTAQLQFSEKALKRANEINHKIDLIMKHLKSSPPVSMEVSNRQEIEYNKNMGNTFV
jgi:hypothetical protein